MTGPSELKTFLYPLAMLCNTTIGIGIFALPFVVMRAGLLATLLYFTILGSAVCAVHLMFGEVALQTPDYKRLPGFAKIHLGEWAQITAVLATVVGFLGSMAAFLIIGGQFLYQLLSPALGGQELAYSAIYAAAGAVLIFFGVNLVSKVGLWSLLAFFAILCAIAVKGLPLVSPQNFSIFPAGRPTDIFLPYGTILFALWASSSIPEVEEMLGRKKSKHLLASIILLASAIAITVYIFFSLLIVGITGPETAELALIGLKAKFGAGTSYLMFLFGFITSFTSFMIMGLTLKKVLAYDCGLPKTAAWAVSSFVPVLLLFLGFNNFISIFSFVGGVLLGLDGILILLMYQKIRPAKKILTYPLILIFFGGIIYELAYYLKW